MPKKLFEKRQWPIVIGGILTFTAIGLIIPYYIADKEIHGVYEGTINIATIFQIIVTIIVGTFFSRALSKLNNEISLSNSNTRVMQDELMKYCMDNITNLKKINSLTDPRHLEQREETDSFGRKTIIVVLPSDKIDEVKSIRTEINDFIATVLRTLAKHKAIELEKGLKLVESPQPQPENFSKEISSLCASYQSIWEDFWKEISGEKSPDFNLLKVISRDNFISTYTLSEQKCQDIQSLAHDLKFEINKHIFH